MKFVKGISLFFIYPLVMFGIGFYAGVESMHFFYPGTNPVRETQELPEENWPEQIVDKLNSENNENNANLYENSFQAEDNLTYDNIAEGLESGIAQNVEDGTSQDADVLVADVSASGETLSVDTEYVLEETDIANHSVVEIVTKLPGKYIGVNR